MSRNARSPTLRSRDKGRHAAQTNDRAWQHPWLRVERLIPLDPRSAPGSPDARPVMKATLVKALKEREKIRRAGWFSCRLGGPPPLAGRDSGCVAPGALRAYLKSTNRQRIADGPGSGPLYSNSP